MKVTITIDGALLVAAAKASGISGTTALVDAGLRVLVERGAAKHLAALGGSMPDLKVAPRRRGASGERGRRRAG